MKFTIIFVTFNHLLIKHHFKNDKFYKTPHMIFFNLIYIFYSVKANLEILYKLKDLLLRKLESKEYRRYDLKEKFEVVILTTTTENFVINLSNNFCDFYSKEELIKYINRDSLEVTKELIDICTKIGYQKIQVKF